jgi:hypothetical protein
MPPRNFMRHRLTCTFFTRGCRLASLEESTSGKHVQLAGKQATRERQGLRLGGYQWRQLCFKPWVLSAQVRGHAVWQRWFQRRLLLRRGLRNCCKKPRPRPMHLFFFCGKHTYIQEQMHAKYHGFDFRNGLFFQPCWLKATS